MKLVQPFLAANLLTQWLKMPINSPNKLPLLKDLMENPKVDFNMQRKLGEKLHGGVKD